MTKRNLKDIPDEEIYVCQVCGYEDHQDMFGQFCPQCGSDLDEFEEDTATREDKSHD